VRQRKSKAAQARAILSMVGSAVTVIVLVTLIVIFRSHLKDMQHNEVVIQVTEQQPVDSRAFALEIRATGLAVDAWHQSSIWSLIKK
jgi:hypothetical protein